MTNDVQLIVHFSCPRCVTVYAATQEQQPRQHPGDFHCRGCGTQVHSWTGLYNFVNWKPVTTKCRKNGTLQQQRGGSRAGA